MRRSLRGKVNCQIAAKGGALLPQPCFSASHLGCALKLQIMRLQEVVLCSLAPSASGQGTGNVSMYDLSTGATLFSLKQTSANEKCTFGIETFDGQGGLIFTAQSDKALLNVYSYQKVYMGNFMKIGLRGITSLFRTSCIFVSCFRRN